MSILAKRYLGVLLFCIFLSASCVDNSIQMQSSASKTAVSPLEFGGELLLPGGEELHSGDLRDFFKKADYILVGEKHTSFCDHLSQAMLLESLLKAGIHPVVGMEMLSVEQQPVLDRFNQGEIQLDELPEALHWGANVGYPFDYYRPVLAVAARYKLPVYALNVPNRLVREIRISGMRGVKNSPDKRFLPKQIVLAPVEQRNVLSAVFAAHTERFGYDNTPEVMGMPLVAADAPKADSGRIKSEAEKRKEQIARERFDRFVLAMSIWDSGMAEQAVAVNKKSGRPVYIIAGTGHVEYGWGIAHRLNIYDSSAHIIRVMPWRKPMEAIEKKDREDSPVLPGIHMPDIFPAADIADAYFYCPPEYIGKNCTGFTVGYAPEGRRNEIFVLEVASGSLADKAGLKKGDVFLRAAGRPLLSPGALHNLIAQYSAYGYPLQLEIRRGTEMHELSLSLR